MCDEETYGVKEGRSVGKARIPFEPTLRFTQSPTATDAAIGRRQMHVVAVFVAFVRLPLLAKPIAHGRKRRITANLPNAFGFPGNGRRRNTTSAVTAHFWRHLTVVSAGVKQWIGVWAEVVPARAMQEVQNGEAKGCRVV